MTHYLQFFVLWTHALPAWWPIWHRVLKHFRKGINHSVHSNFSDIKTQMFEGNTFHMASVRNRLHRATPNTPGPWPVFLKSLRHFSKGTFWALRALITSQRTNNFKPCQLKGKICSEKCCFLFFLDPGDSSIFLDRHTCPPSVGNHWRDASPSRCVVS